PAILGVARSPREADARREIAMVSDIGLPFVTQAVAEREVGANAPIVLRKQAEIVLHDARIRIAGIDIELRSAAPELPDPRWTEARGLEHQGARVLIDRGKRGHQRIAAGIGHDLVAGIQHGSRTAIEEKLAAEAIGRRTAIAFAPRAHAVAE